MRQHIIYRFIGILLSFQALLGQEYSFSYNFVNYNINNGFPSSEVYYGLRDAKGFYWFATDKGVSKYNGIEFENYNTQQNLSDNNIISLFEDNHKNIWFISTNSLSTYDLYNNEISPYPYNNKIIAARLKSPIVTAFVDEAHTVFLILKGQGYIKISDKGQFSIYNEKVVFDRKFGFYILSEGIYQPVFWRNTPLPSHIFEKLYQKSFNEEIYCSDKNAVIRTTDNSIEIRNFRNFSIEEYVTIDPINSVSVSNLNNTILLSTDNGIIKYFRTQEKQLNYLQGNKIHYTLDASKRGLFVLSMDNGLFIIPSNSILSLNENGSQYQKPIAKIMANPKELFILKEYQNNPLVYSNYEFSQRDSPLTLDDLKQINSKTSEKTIKVTLGPEYNFVNSPRLYDLDILSFTFDHNLLYFLTSDAIFKVKGNNIEQIHVANGIVGQANTICHHKGYIWIGTNVGIYRYNNQSNRLQFIKTKQNFHVLNMVNYYEKKLIVGSQNNGLLIFDGLKYQVINTENGGVSNLINDMLVDNYKIWIATGNGVAQLIDTKEGFKVADAYSYSDGLNSTDITTIAVYNQDIFAGSKYGLNKINPFLKPKNYLRAYIKHIKVNNQNIPIGKNVEVPNKGVLEIDLMLNSYNSQSPKTYYRIKELNDQFRLTSNLSIIYESLNAGSYTLEYYAQDFIEKTPIQQLKINVESAWYAKWYMILIFILLAGFGIYYAIKNYSEKIQARYKKEQEINRYKLLAFNKQMSSHFISNSFNAINNFILKKDNVGGSRYLSKMSKLFRHSLLATEKNYIPFNQEIEAIKSYIELEKLRYNNSFEYAIIVSDTIPYNRVSVMPLIMQTLVENAIWHGLLPSKKDEKRISMNVEKTAYPNLLKVTIEDNGVGINLAHLQKEESKGIQLVKSILKTNSYTKPIDSENIIKFANIEPQEEEKGTRCTFYIPVIISI